MSKPYVRGATIQENKEYRVKNAQCQTKRLADQQIRRLVMGTANNEPHIWVSSGAEVFRY